MGLRDLITWIKQLFSGKKKGASKEDLDREYNRLRVQKQEALDQRKALMERDAQLLEEACAAQDESETEHVKELLRENQTNLTIANRNLAKVNRKMALVQKAMQRVDIESDIKDEEGFLDTIDTGLDDRTVEETMAGQQMRLERIRENTERLDMLQAATDEYGEQLDEVLGNASGSAVDDAIERKIAEAKAKKASASASDSASVSASAPVGKSAAAPAPRAERAADPDE